MTAHADRVRQAKEELVQAALAIKDSDPYQTGQDGDVTAVRDEVLQPMLDSRDALLALEAETCPKCGGTGESIAAARFPEDAAARSGEPWTKCSACDSGRVRKA